MVTDLTKPESTAYACPSCGKRNEATSRFLQGMHFLASCTCDDCNTSFFHTLPVAHTRDFPIAFSHDGKITEYAKAKASWLALPLIRSMTTTQSFNPEIEIETYSPARQEAILINCLDDCFGHVFTKLCNISVCRKKFPDQHIIVLLPAKMKWLLPAQLDEAWLVGGPLSQMSDKIGGLDAFLEEQKDRFEQLLLHEVSIYADPVEVDFQDYLKVPSYDYSRKPELPWKITFILREDRFWLRGKMEETLFKSGVKSKKLDKLKPMFCRLQNKRVLATIKKIKTTFPEAEFSVAGLGKTGEFPSEVTDLRKESITPEDEKDWLVHYAKSHLVAGIHGSNMILPGIQAASMVEMVPSFKIQHIGETNLKDYPKENLCRHLIGFTPPTTLAKTIVETLKLLKK